MGGAFETLAKWRAHSRGFGVERSKVNRDTKSRIHERENLFAVNSRRHFEGSRNNNNDFFDGNGALRVSKSETRVLTCGLHYRGVFAKRHSM